MVSLKSHSRRVRFFAGPQALAFVLAVAGCSGSTSGTTIDPGPETTTTSVVVTTTTTTAPPSVDPVDWNDSAVQVDLGDGWTVGACAGDAPLLCVAKDGSEVGVVEASAYDVDAFDNIDPGAEPATILNQFGTGFIEAMTADRVTGCGDDYQVTPIGPSLFPFDAVEVGMTFGFEGRAAGSQPSELVIHYAAVFDETIVSLVAAAYDEDGCLGRDDLGGFTTEQLEEVRDSLEAVLAISPLPLEKVGINAP